MTRGRAVTVLMALTVALQLGGCASGPQRGAPVEDRTKAPAASAPQKSKQVKVPQETGAVIKPLSRGSEIRAVETPASPRALEPVPVEGGGVPGALAPVPPEQAYPAEPSYGQTPPAAVAPPVETPFEASAPSRPVSASGAVVALLDNAGQQARTGQLDASAATLERALRIEPDNAAIWNRLAAIRLQQGRADQAASLAAKSNALAGNDRELQVRNWRIIAQARRAQGDAQGARAAEERAAELAAD